MGLRDEIHRLKEAPPGRRFEDGHDRTKVDNRPLRLFLVALGLALMVAAAVTFWVPGPNFVLVLAGLALVAGQSRTVARLMDRGEVRARRWNDETWDPYPHKARAIAMLWTIGLALIAVALYVAWRNDWLPGWLPLI